MQGYVTQVLANSRSRLDRQARLAAAEWDAEETHPGTGPGWFVWPWQSPGRMAKSHAQLSPGAAPTAAMAAQHNKPTSLGSMVLGFDGWVTGGEVRILLAQTLTCAMLCGFLGLWMFGATALAAVVEQVSTINTFTSPPQPALLVASTRKRQKGHVWVFFFGVGGAVCGGAT